MTSRRHLRGVDHGRSQATHHLTALRSQRNGLTLPVAVKSLPSSWVLDPSSRFCLLLENISNISTVSHK